MAQEEKVIIVEKLLESKAITFREALKLLETEKEYVYQYWPYYQPLVTYDFNAPGSCYTETFVLTCN